MQLRHSGSSPAAFATQQHSCRTFKQDVKTLYLFSLLLTGEEHSAERCFFSSLEDCMSLKPVLKEWANAWTRRVVLQNAIRMLHPAAHEATSRSQPEVSPVSALVHPALKVVLQLSLFERFVFVISVLEGYSDRECSLLLRSSHQEIAATKARALQHLATASKQKQCTTTTA